MGALVGTLTIGAPPAKVTIAAEPLIQVLAECRAFPGHGPTERSVEAVIDAIDSDAIRAEIEAKRIRIQRELSRLRTA